MNREYTDDEDIHWRDLGVAKILRENVPREIDVFENANSEQKRLKGRVEKKRDWSEKEKGKQTKFQNWWRTIYISKIHPYLWGIPIRICSRSLSWTFHDVCWSVEVKSSIYPLRLERQADARHTTKSFAANVMLAKWRKFHHFPEFSLKSDFLRSI